MRYFLQSTLFSFMALAATFLPAGRLNAQCNTNTSICTPGVAGPFNFIPSSGVVSSCLDFWNGTTAPNYGYILLYITSSGPLNMLINANTTGGFLDVAVFNIPQGSNPCTAIQNSANEIGCNYASSASGCNQFGTYFPCAASVPAPNVVAGQVLMILVEDWSNVQNSYTLELAPTGAQTGPPNPAITPAGPFCVSAPSTQLTAASPGGTWSGPGVSSSGSFNPATAGIGTHTINYAIGTAPCNSASSTTITVTAGPSFTMGSNSPICAGNTLNLTSTTVAGGTYSWTGPNGFSSSLQNPSITNATTAASGTYSLTVSASGCTPVTQTVNVTVNPGPVVSASSNSPICENSTLNLNTTTVAGASYSWTGPNGFTSSSQNPSIPGATVAASGTYTVTANAAGCVSAPSSVTVTVNPAPVVTASSNSPICEGGTLSLGATTIAGATYSWTGPNGFSSSVQNPSLPAATAAMSGTYTVTASANGCTGLPSNVSVVVTPMTPPVVSNDVSICAGECTNLSASGADYYLWSPATGLSSTTIANPVACPPATTTYTVTAYTSGPNSVVNGDFSSGNSGFTSNYLYTGNPSAEGTYYVGPDANAVHPGFSGVDHTGGGNFMIINGSGVPNSSVWCQTVNVTPGTDYSFSTWVSTLAVGSPAILNFSINGVQIGTTFTAPATTGVWTEFYATWNSGANTTATICIVNQNTSLGGNDFGLDDIFFSSVCTSTETVTVTISSTLDATITPAGPFCEGEAAVNLTAADAGGTWSGTGITNASAGTFSPSAAGTGTHTITYIIPGACGDTSTTSITVNPNLDATITPAGPFCLSSSSVILTAADPGGTWSGNGITDSATGEFDPATAGIGSTTITYSIGGACGDTATTVINVINQINASINPAGPFCASNANVFLAGTPSGGVWSGTGIINSSTGEFSPSTALGGNHTISYSFGGQCGDTATTTIQVFTDANATIVPVSNICIENGITDLSSVEPNGVWSGNGIINTATGEFDPVLAGVGQHTITYSISGVCGDQQSVQVTVIDTANTDINFAGPFCVDASSVTLTAATPGGIWSGTGITSSANGTFDPSVAGAGTHTITYSITGFCGNSSTTDITVNPLPTVSFTADSTSGCSPVATTFTNNSSASVNCVWSVNGITASTGCGNFSNVFTAPGCYDITLAITDANGCTNSSTLSDLVCVFDYPVADFIFGPQDATIVNPVIQFSNLSQNANSNIWDFGGLGISSEVSPSYTFPSVPDTHSVCLSVSTINGCQDNICHDVIIYDEYLLFAPNAFTVDGDGLNDVWLPYISGIDPDSYELYIFNRWGEIVFESHNSEIGWDGNYRGMPAKQDVYVWKVKAKRFNNNESVQYTGHVNLLR